MKIIIAQSTSSALAGHERYRQALCVALEGEGHKTQCLDLPSIAEPGRALTNIASLRLLGTAASAEVLICLDPVAAVLDHPRKIVVMLDDAFLAADSAQLPEEPAAGRAFVANVLRSSLGEARVVFAPSRFAHERLAELSFDRVTMLQPTLPPARFHYRRNPGPELLVVGSMDDRQRRELLVTCLAALPEPLRVRWIAPDAAAASNLRLREQAASAGVEHRLVVDVHSLDPGESAYLLSQAAACLDLARASLVVSDLVLQAHQAGVPIISCSDGGAVTELSGSKARQPAKPNGIALAAAVHAAVAVPVVESARSARSARPGIGWAPLLEVVSQ